MKKRPLQKKLSLINSKMKNKIKRNIKTKNFKRNKIMQKVT